MGLGKRLRRISRDTIYLLAAAALIGGCVPSEDSFQGDNPPPPSFEDNPSPPPPAGSPDLTITIDSVTSSGSTVTINYTVKNSGSASAGAFGVDVWAHRIIAPTPSATLTGDNFTSYNSIAAGASLTGSLSVTSTLTSGTAHATVDTRLAITESNEGNNVASKTWTGAGSTPDLTITIDSVTKSGSTVTINYTVTNSGLASAGPFSVDGWANRTTAPTPNESLFGDRSAFYISLDAGASKTGSFDVFSTLTSGTAYATVDTRLAVTESNEGNNVASKTWTGSTPDLTIAIDSVTKSGSTVTINYTVTNSGSASAGGFTVDGWANRTTAPTPNESLFGDRSAFYISLDAGASKTGSLDVFSTLTGGTAYATVDTRLAITESNEGNNVASKTWTTLDLTITIDSVTKSGSTVTIAYTVTNNGSASAGGFRVDVWANHTTAPTPSATLSGDNFTSYNSLAAGASLTGSLAVTSALTSGTAYATVDTNLAVTESNENNNVASRFW
jgi:subtilase family serine protease